MRLTIEKREYSAEDDIFFYDDHVIASLCFEDGAFYTLYSFGDEMLKKYHVVAKNADEAKKKFNSIAKRFAYFAMERYSIEKLTLIH